MCVFRTCGVISLYFVCSLLLLTGFSHGFNLEHRIPIIKYGELGSYFGFSVAEHQIIPDNGEQPYNLILVGAPLGQNLQPGTNRSGALFKCRVSTNPYDCQQVITDGRRTDDSSTSLEKPLPEDMKDGQWMGAVVQSRGDLVLVCAHRYMKDYWGNGLCYTLQNDLTPDNSIEPCDGRSKNRAHEEFGYCQAGTSGTFLDDGTLILGSPGPYTWRGTLFVFDMSADYLSRDKHVYHGPLNNDNKPVDKYSYLGMSVAAGNFFDKDNVAYAAGGPRSNNTGQVVFFTKTPGNTILNIVLTLNGEQFASSFGYEMIAADINGDGLQDLIVGAPFYFTKEEGGAVYVYTSSYKECNLTCTPPLILKGNFESRFGFSLANLGDLNKDGYEDIAIGAPYENNGVIYIYLGSRNGLIKTPSQIIRSENLPVGNIKTLGYSLSGGTDMDNNGYPDLLAGAFEQDAIVLFRARPIIDIKTDIRPQSNLRNIDPSINGCPADPLSNHTCFTFEACCKIMSLLERTRSQHQILNYNIEAETFTGNRKFSRVWFGKDPQRPHIINTRISITEINKEYCQKHTVYIKENTRDILSPIKFRLNYTLEQQVPVHKFQSPLPVIDNYPILNQQEAEKIFNATFQKDCGSNDICESDIILEAHPHLTEENGQYILSLGVLDEIKLELIIQNLAEPAYEAQLFVAHPEGLSYIAVIGEKQILCNPFNGTLVVCSLGNPFKPQHDVSIILRFDPKTLNDDIKQFKFKVFANSTSTEITEKSPIDINVAIMKKAEVNIKGSAFRTNVIYGGKIKGESAMAYGDDVGSNVTHIYVVDNQGPWKVGRLTIEVWWPYQVANDKPEGKWLLYLEKPPIIDAPNGGECYLANDQINPLNLSSKSDLSDSTLSHLRMPILFPDTEPVFLRRRTKRYTEVIVRHQTIVDEDGRTRKVVKMDCERGTAKCIKFNCTVFNLPPHDQAILQIRARLWNSTLLEDYPQMDWVEIRSQAKIHILPEYSIQQNTLDDFAFVDTIAYPDLLNQQAVEPISIWIIIVAIIAGLILLIIMIIILWKCGFFKRRRPDPTLSGNLEKHEESPFLGRNDE